MAEKKKYLDALVEAEHFINHLFGASVEVVYACFERDIAEVARKDVVRLREYGTALAYSIKQSALERNKLRRHDPSRMETEELWNCCRRITYLDDVIEATIILGENVGGYEIFNIANEHEETIGVLATKIKNLTRSSSEIVLMNAPAKRYDFEVSRRFGCSEKLKRYVGFKPETNLDEGLKRVYQDLQTKWA